MSKRINYTAAAEMLGVGVWTLRSMVHRKQVPHIRLTAGTILFDTDALSAWMSERDGAIARTMQADLDEKVKGRDLYAVFCTVTRLCKIGRSNDAQERLRDMQIGSPTRLVLWCHAPLIGDLEPSLHRAFSEFRMHGEWFSPALTERIASAVPPGDVEAFARFASEAHDEGKRRLRAARRAARQDTRGTFEWRGKRRKR